MSRISLTRSGRKICVHRITWQNMDEIIRPLCENWIIFAEFIIGLGAYPAFPALGETSDDNGAVYWLDAMLGYMRDNQKDRFTAIANNGMWCATHPYSLNHFYQEFPGQPATPRPYQNENGTESGWHFEYPYDPYTQSFDPGRNVFGNPSAPNGDPNGITAMGIAFNQRMSDGSMSGRCRLSGQKAVFTRCRLTNYISLTRVFRPMIVTAMPKRRWACSIGLRHNHPPGCSASRCGKKTNTSIIICRLWSVWRLSRRFRRAAHFHHPVLSRQRIRLAPVRYTVNPLFI